MMIFDLDYWLLTTEMCSCTSNCIYRSAEKKNKQTLSQAARWLAIKKRKNKLKTTKRRTECRTETKNKWTCTYLPNKHTKQQPAKQAAWLPACCRLVLTNKHSSLRCIHGGLHSLSPRMCTTNTLFISRRTHCFFLLGSVFLLTV